MLYTTQTLSEKWTTSKGTQIDLTVTIETYDYDYKRIYALKVNGVEADPYMIKMIDGKNVLVASIKMQEIGVVISDEIKSKIDNMIATAKQKLAPRVAEYNEEEEIRRRVERS